MNQLQLIEQYKHQDSTEECTEYEFMMWMKGKVSKEVMIIYDWNNDIYYVKPCHSRDEWHYNLKEGRYQDKEHYENLVVALSFIIEPSYNDSPKHYVEQITHIFNERICEEYDTFTKQKKYGFKFNIRDLLAIRKMCYKHDCEIRCELEDFIHHIKDMKALHIFKKNYKRTEHQILVENGQT